ncbi:adenylate kinase family enzyme [Sanguibacter antarcticus]|uniref:Adenylate kinase family enzyme n=1 Tax=Sanguibacter antarcticus TaxID=372484 RepID=A0A2A9E966_9MICO|nr:adenylate kinase family enzyme [Sanguibacter antarcticus]
MRPSRITVAGTSGSGKTTLARRISAVLGAPFTEMDGLYHGPGWVPRDAFVADVTALVAQDAWVTEWGYQAARPLVLERAEVLVWLDLPVWTVMRQVVTRTVRRSVRREVLWNGNVEGPLWRLLRRGDGNIVDWAWTTRHALDGLDRRLDDEAPHVVLVRLRSRAEVETWVETLADTLRQGRDPEQS